MRREGMPQGVRTDRLGNARGAGGFPDRLLDGRLVQVVATLEARARVAGAIMGREGPLPGPIELGGRVLARERLRQVNRAETLGEIPPVERPNGFEVQSKGVAYGKRKHRPPILLTLSVPNQDLAHSEVHVLDPQPQRLEQAKAAPVEEKGHQAHLTLEIRQEAHRFIFRQHRRQTTWAFGPDEPAEVWKRNLQDVAIKEQESRERLRLSRG